MRKSQRLTSWSASGLFASAIRKSPFAGWLTKPVPRAVMALATPFSRRSRARLPSVMTCARHCSNQQSVGDGPVASALTGTSLVDSTDSAESMGLGWVSLLIGVSRVACRVSHRSRKSAKSCSWNMSSKSNSRYDCLARLLASRSSRRVLLLPSRAKTCSSLRLIKSCSIACGARAVSPRVFRSRSTSSLSR